MTPTVLRRALCIACVLGASCAALDRDMPLTVTAGSSICTAPTLGKCEELQRVADSLNTGPLAKAIEEARK